MRLSRQDGGKCVCSSRHPACAQLGSRIQGLSKHPPSLAKPPPHYDCLSGSSLCTPVRPTAWPIPQSPALFSASPVDLNPGCSRELPVEWITVRQLSPHVFRASHDNIQKLSYSWPRASLQGLNAFKSFNFEQGDTDYHIDDQENGLVAINHFCTRLMGPGTAQGTSTAWHQVSSGTNVALWAPDNKTCNFKCFKPVVSLESAWVMRRLLGRLLHLHFSAWHQVYELNGVLRRSKCRRPGWAEGIWAGNVLSFLPLGLN